MLTGAQGLQTAFPRHTPPTLKSAAKHTMPKGSFSRLGGSISISGGSQDVMLDPEPKPVQRGWAGELARGAKDEPGLATQRHILKAQDSSTYRSQSPPALATIILGQEIALHRKEYYGKGLYLRSCSHPELMEDVEDEHQDGSAHWTWVID
ncbi:uncharacterized protein LOC116553230 isoform X3 [Sapajus apella]|uniref:Uncharacterized protein LOC116553230 isoform X3 n=1 Tax=Sapajus apella TaxID=9515 RepID=A0A6J3I191_SAPAP|nr:uncharacterized protein LOC116553230 isoform X3 [Sapajus apella]